MDLGNLYRWSVRGNILNHASKTRTSRPKLPRLQEVLPFQLALWTIVWSALRMELARSLRARACFLR